MEFSVQHDISHSADEARRQLESLLDELAEMSDASISSVEFYDHFLDRLAFATSSLGAAIWSRGPNGQLVLIHKTALSGPYPSGQAAKGMAEDQSRLFAVFSSREANILPGSSFANQPYEILAVPMVVAGNTWGVVALYCQARLAKSVSAAYLRIVRAFAEIGQHYEQQTQLREFQKHQIDWKRQLEFSDQVHKDLQYQSTAYRIANQARDCLDVDRVSVLSARASRCRLEAISGVDRPNRRSNAVRHLERLASTVLREKEPLFFSGNTEDLSPQVEKAVMAYLEDSPSRVMAIIPLTPRTTVSEDESAQFSASEQLGAIILESIEEIDTHALMRRCEPVVRHASSALGNARQYQRIPFVSVLRPVASCLATVGWYRLSTTLKIAIPLIAILVALFVIQIDFSIEARGKLVPLVQRNLFAPSDAYVEKIFVDHGSSVKAGDPLLQLRSNEFALKRAEIVGQLQTAQAELDAILVKRSQGMRRDPRSNPRETFEDLSADQARLTKQIENLTYQRELLTKREAELLLESPIDGQVLDWELEQILTSRPVGRGDLLMQVADIDGPWHLELELPDRRSYHVAQAQQKSNKPLPVRFQLVNEPGKQYDGLLVDTAKVVDLDDQATQPVVPLKAVFEKEDIPHLRHGLTVVARVDCGQRSVAYVWTYQLVETVRRHLFW